VSATHVRFVVAWAIGFPTLFLIGLHDGFGALMTLSGLLLMWAGWRLVRDEREWRSFHDATVRGRRFASRTFPDSALARWSFAVGFLIVGAGWAVGGVLGALALLGRYEYPA
jgi:hypothetical protein